MTPTTILLILSAIAPALVLLGLVSLHIRKPWDLVLPRPWWMILWAVVAGVVSAYLALVAEEALFIAPWTITSLGALAFFTLFAVGLAEEGAKYIVMRGMLWRLKPFSEPYDGVLLAAAVGLGFGAAENIKYVLNLGFETALIRAVTAVPLHGMLGVILGAYLGRAKALELADGKTRWGLMFGGLAWAIIGHGIYNFLAFQSNPLAEALLWVCLGVTAVISWRLILWTRSLSPTWGGTGELAPVPFIPPVVTPRTPWVAAGLGLLPGIGQMYNGEWQKGWSLLGVSLVNIVSFAVVWLLIAFPLESLFVLLSWGLTLGDKPEEFLLLLGDTPVLWILGSLMISFSLIGAWDAYRTALSQNFDYRVAPPFRERFIQSVSFAYSGHLLLVLLLTFVPLLMPNGGGGGEPLEFEIVQAPTTLNGHKETPEGTPQGAAKETKREKIAQKIPDPPKKEKGTVPVPQPEEPVQAQQAQGIPRSYTDYLSWKIRQFHDLYFSQVNPDEYTVIRYVIAQDGTVLEVEVLPESSTTPPVIAELAAETIRDMDPLDPLPPGTGTVEVLELFWGGATIAKPGSLEERLSLLPDGRWIQPLQN